MGIEQDTGDEGTWYNNWIGWIYECLSCLDKEQLTWRVLPCSGGYYDQDEKIMAVWETIRVCYIKAKTDPQIMAYIEGKRNATSRPNDKSQ